MEKKVLRKPDADEQSWKLDVGEFSPEKDMAFQKHLRKLKKFSDLARRHFPCLKGKENEFINYVLRNEGLWYSGGKLPYKAAGYE